MRAKSTFRIPEHWGPNWIGTAYFMAALVPWAWALVYVSRAWNENPEYHYGFFVPILSVLLLWLKKPWLVQGKADLRPRWGLALLLFAAPLAAAGELFRSELVYSSLTGWCLCLAAGCLSSGLYLRRMGKGALLRLLPCMVVAALATPLPRTIWSWVSLKLQSMVTAWTTDLAYFLDIPALAKGNVIVTQNGIIGITEACSGLRSLQAVLLFSFFLGHVVLRRNGYRALLIFLGIAVAIAANLGRAVFMVAQLDRGGAEALGRYHDAAGYSVLIASMAALAILSSLLVLKEEPAGAAPSESSRKTKRDRARPLLETPIKDAAVLVYALLLFPLAFLAIDWNLQDREYQNWNFAGGDVRSVPEYQRRSIEPEAFREMLLFDDASDDLFLKDGRLQWRVFNAQWNAGRVSNAAVGVHVPQICFPMGGWTALRDSWIEPVVLGGEAYPALWQYFENESELALVGYLHLVGNEPRIFLRRERGFLSWKTHWWDLQHAGAAPQEVFIFMMRVDDPDRPNLDALREFLTRRYPPVK